MFLKYLFVFSILACGQIAWNNYEKKSKLSRPDLLGYKLVENALSYDGVNSVGGLERVYLPERHSVMPTGIVNLANFEKVDSQRTLRFSAHINTNELLLAGEQLFQGKKRKTLIHTRALLYGQDECKRLQASFVSSCRIKEMKITYDKDDLVHIDYKFGFVQKFQFGNITNDSNLIYEEGQIHFYEIFENSEISDLSLIEQEKVRLKYYKRIVRHCEKIRWLLGTCAVDNINFKYASKLKSQNSLDAVAVDVNFTSLVSLENNYTVEDIK